MTGDVLKGPYVISLAVSLMDILGYKAISIDQYWYELKKKKEFLFSDPVLTNSAVSNETTKWKTVEGLYSSCLSFTRA
ncbi:MAG: hypothetical protein ACXV8J_04215 [Methylobacter sp.]